MGKGRGLAMGALNAFLRCPLCEGYLIDATTITDCPHSFCRSCILSYMEETGDREGNCYCPECPKDATNPVETPIRAEARHLLLQPDTQLQDLVYKLVPGLYKEELRRRRDFYASGGGKAEGGGKWERHLGELFIFTPDEQISFSFQSGFPPKTAIVRAPSAEAPGDALKIEEKAKPDPLSPAKKKKKNAHYKDCLKEKEEKLRELKFKRYFRCPAAVQIGQLKKLLFYKLELPPKYAMEVFHSEPEPLKDSLSLMDLAYIYSWQRKSPMQLYFNIVKPEAEDLVEPPPLLVAQMSSVPDPSPRLCSPKLPPASPQTTASTATTTTATSLPMPSLGVSPAQPAVTTATLSGPCKPPEPPPKKKRKSNPPTKSSAAPPLVPSVQNLRISPLSGGSPSAPPQSPRVPESPSVLSAMLNNSGSSNGSPLPHGSHFPMPPPFGMPFPPGMRPPPGVFPSFPPHAYLSRYGFPGSMPFSTAAASAAPFSPSHFPPALFSGPPMGRGSPSAVPTQAPHGPLTRPSSSGPALPPAPLSSDALSSPSGLFPAAPPLMSLGRGAQPPPTSAAQARFPGMTGIPTVLYDGGLDSRGMQGLLVFRHP